METKLCRICGKLGENYVHIFKTEGLKNKIETCLPIIVSPHCLLPDTICSECLENVDNFYSFIKNCLQNIIVLEAQYDITESCLKTKRKHEKSSLTDFNIIKFDKNIQTDEGLNDKRTCILNLVNYDLDSDDSPSEHEDNGLEGKVVIAPKSQPKKFVPPKTSINYFDDAEKDLISEIAQRKSLKRKNDTILPYKTKIFKMDTSSRRKCKQPKKVAYINSEEGPSMNSLEKICEQIEKNAIINFSDVSKFEEYTEADKLSALQEVEKEINNSLPQVCLLCDTQFNIPSALAAHVYETHGIDMAQVVPSTDPTSTEKKKKIPNLLKITDLKFKNDLPEDAKQQTSDSQTTEEPPTLQPSFVCPICPATLTNRSDLFTHLRTKHSAQASLLCGLCLHVATSYPNLNAHLETCKSLHAIPSKYVCKICCYNDDNCKSVENHVLVHDFLLAFCKKQAKVFDPGDYIEINPNSTEPKELTCTECNQSGFASFKEFSTHRRSQHQIFHCDLCNKFYGRNSHLWKHVNRLHKGHPSITCQICYKTSASKYHLAQHFNKIHSAKPCKQKVDSEDDFMSQKFRAFDFQSVKQSFMRQELQERENHEEDALMSDGEEVSNNSRDEEEEYSESVKMNPEMQTNKALPKEIDSSSDLYTNIITNYTPPQNEGEFKCPKCFKGFHKKNLLKKHKKNCRPRLQKDLLTRCKTCSRIFKDRQSLTKHLINYHSEYACEICGQKVQSKCEIVSHIRFSHPNCYLFCHCGNILRNKLDLNEHKRDHCNSFVCQFCADMLPTKIKLKMHILSLHRKILSLSCGICLKLFETQYILRDHVRLVHKEHLSPLTSCTVCGKNYGSKWKTFDHLNKSHGRIFKACKACLEVFESEEAMQTHYNASHANTPQNKNVVIQNNLNVRPEVKYESDFEPANDENFEKMSLSESSNDAENAEAPEDVKHNDLVAFPEMAMQETKLSLLEKRLLGKKPSEPEKTPPKLKPMPNSVPQQLPLPLEPKKDKKVQKATEIIRKNDIDESDLNFSQNPLQNSSKRTVYVNSNDPSLCEICLKTWPAKKHLWQHYIRCHKSVAATVCGICLKTNDDYATLQIHLKENHPTLLHGQGFGSNFICRICGRYHNASSKLKLHMAIHENFDWSLLNDAIEKDMLETNDSRLSNQTIANQKQKNNGCTENQETYENYYLKQNNSFVTNEDINYESMIEQVECSSDSDVEESENENENGNGESKQESSSDEESEIESGVSENSLETQMLHNMLREKQTVISSKDRIKNRSVKQEIKEETEDDDDDDEREIKEEYSSSDSEETSNSTGSYSDTEIDVYENNVKHENCSSGDEDYRAQKSLNASSNSNTNDSAGNIYGQKPGELDSAIRSISYEPMGNVNDDIDEEFCEVQSQGLNQNEIESAVDSIL